MNIVAVCRGEICTLFINLYFTCPVTSFMFGEQEVRIPSMLLSSLCELKCVVGTSNMAAPISWSASCSQACQKIVLGTPGFEDFDFLIHVAQLRNAELVIWCYLFVYLLVCRTVEFLHMCISGLSKLIFHLLRGRVSGENCHFRLRSTTSGTHFDPHDTHSLRHMTQRMS